MNRFAWLLRREWMQHHRGWLILSLVPLLLSLLVLPFAQIHINRDGVIAVPVLAVIGATGYLYGLVLIVSATVMFQAGGMARRDQQDRSVEFWVSLPTSHWQSLLAMVLMHVLLMPLLALTIAFASAQLVAVGLVLKVAGASAMGSAFDASWLGYQALAFGRLVLGLVVATLWLSAVLVGAMASAAWLKGWGMPALAAAAGIGGLLVSEFTGSPVVWDAIALWFRQATVALMPLTRGEGAVKAAIESGGIEGLRSQLAGDTAQLLRDLATPQLAAALLLTVLAFGLLVLKRSGGLTWPKR